jgi:hypothetical protein
MITILLIDDDIEYIKSLVNNAKLSDLNLIYHQNYEAGFEEIHKNPSIQGLIFDAKCWKTKKEQENEVEPSEDALAEGLKLLADYEKNTEHYLPLVVNTGYTFPLQYFKPALSAFKAQIFEKAKANPEDIFGHLKNLIQNSESYQIERKYTDVFEIFEKGYLGQDVREKLLNILRNINRTENAEISKTLSAIRAVKEEIIRNQPNPSQPNLISSLSMTIQKNASDYGSHPPRVKDIQPTKYTVISLTHALLEMLLWFKSEKEK